MYYTLEQIEKLTFTRTILNGYKKSEVDYELSKIKQDFEDYITQTESLKAETQRLGDSLKRYQSIEEAMQQCLVIAQQTGDTMRQSASQKAQEIISSAESTAQKIISDANLEASKVKFGYDDARSKVFTFRKKSEALLQAQLDILKQMEEA